MKKFSEIYANAIKNNKEQLEKLRKKFIFRFVISLAYVFIIIGIMNHFEYELMKLEDILAIPGIILFIFLVRILEWASKPLIEYKKNYKYAIVANFVKGYDENLNFEPQGRISESFYRKAGFDKSYDLYSSEDLISGKIDNHEILIGEVRIRKDIETIGVDKNDTPTFIVFQGIFASIEISNTYNGELKIHSDKVKLDKVFGDKKRIEIDSSEFEKYFDVYAEDKIQAMQFLTSDIIEELIQFRKENNIKFEITIEHNHLYIRFHTGKMFEANLLKSSVNIDTLARLYNIINFTLDLTRKLVKISEETEI